VFKPPFRESYTSGGQLLKELEANHWLSFLLVKKERQGQSQIANYKLVAYMTICIENYIVVTF
jgi:hypothetical protein